MKMSKTRLIKAILPLIIIILILILGAAFLWKTEGGRLFVKDAKSAFADLAAKVPFLEKLIKKETSMPAIEEMPEEAVLVKVYKVDRRDFEDTLPSLGTIKGYREMNLKFEVNGVIDSINFREGEEVREGDIIASLDQYDSLLKLKYAKIELDKNKKLYDIGSIIKTRLDQAELEYESAKSDLDKTYLYAPRDGVLGTRDAEVGEFITSSEKVATLIDDADVFVEIGVIERDIGKITVGQDAKVYVDPYPDIDFKGKVDNISPVVEGRSRTQSAKIRVNNAKRLLLPGMFARVLVDIFAMENAIVVPNSALNKTENGYIVYVVHKRQQETSEETAIADGKKGFAEEKTGEEGVTEARPILFEYRSSDFSVIKDGLEEGELVVIETQEKLKDKMDVTITEVREQFL